jgi:D-alanine-D-alanine ligase
MKITVLFGGPSAEREVSLVSGRAVIDALRAGGHDVYPSDISPSNLTGLEHAADVIFPVLHGAFGESGELQEILEQRGLPFVGSGSAASRLAMDKVASKAVWQAGGLLTAPWEIITPAAPASTLPPPCAVKPIDSGSSIDVSICRTPIELDLACDQILSRYPRAMVERFVEGPEITVGLLNGQPLEPIRIVSSHDFFDFEAKYKDRTTQHRFDLNSIVAQRCRDLAFQANHLLGCRDLARVDMIVHDDRDPVLLEINTLPGFTPTSLLPDAAAHAGIEFVELVDRLVHMAYSRGVDQRPQVRVAIADDVRTKSRPIPSRKTA